MYYRRKILLALLQIFGGSLTKTDLQKYLFLFNVEEDEPVYEFIPYKYGCYSPQSNQDLTTLSKYKIIEDSENYWKVIDRTNYITQLKTDDKIRLLNFHSRFNKLKGDALIKYVYENHPYYAINSKIAKQLLNAEKYNEVLNCKPKQNDYALFTIGYEGKTVEYYTNQLIKENVKVLCDIRKNPLSMKYGFSKNQLKNIVENVVENVGIKYIHFPELGIDSNKRQELNSKKDYDRLFEDYEKNTLPGKDNELEKLCDIFRSNKRIALTCFEADYNCCHRSRTAKALNAKFGKENYIIHI
jgi:uncharacterized protein (DUF488 family)